MGRSHTRVVDFLGLVAVATLQVGTVAHGHFAGNVISAHVATSYFGIKPGSRLDRRGAEALSPFKHNGRAAREANSTRWSGYYTLHAAAYSAKLCWHGAYAYPQLRHVEPGRPSRRHARERNPTWRR
eukprot:scaffold823_cov397-Prasinococcus_capsulatus_cf.AAC.6